MSATWYEVRLIYVRIRNKKSSVFYTKAGLKQVWVPVPLLFNTLLDEDMKKM